MTLELCYNGNNVTIGNFYEPHADNTRAIEYVLSKVAEYENASMIIGGDFNFCLDLRKTEQAQHDEFQITKNVSRF